MNLSLRCVVSDGTEQDAVEADYSTACPLRDSLRRTRPWSHQTFRLSEATQSALGIDLVVAVATTFYLFVDEGRGFI